MSSEQPLPVRRSSTYSQPANTQSGKNLTLNCLSPNGRRASGMEWDTARSVVKVRNRLKEAIRADELVDPEQLLQLEKIFKSHPKEELSEKEFIHSFSNVLGHSMSTDDLRVWFMRIDANANGSVDWNEFSSHLLYNHKGALENVRSREYVQNTLQPETRTARLHKQQVCKVLVHERTSHYWSVSHDGMVKIWSPHTLKHMHCINNNISLTNKASSVMVTDMCFGASGSAMYLATVDKTINVYDPRCNLIKKYIGRKMYNELKGESHTITTGFKKDGEIPHHCPYQKVETTALLQMEEPTSSLATIQLGDREHLLTGLNSGQVYCYPLLRGFCNSLNPVTKMAPHTGLVTNIMHLSNLSGTSLLTSSWDRTLKLVDLERGSVTQHIGEGHKHAINSIDWNQESKLVVSSGPERDVSLWNPFINSPVATLSGHLTNVVGVVFNSTDNQIISMSSDKCIKIWDLRTLKLFQSFFDDSDSHPAKGFTSLTYDNKNQRLVAASTCVHVWPIRRSIPNFTPEYRGHADPLVAVLIAENFDQTVTVDVGGTVQVWNIQTGDRDFLFQIPAYEGKTREGNESAVLSCACFDVFERRVILGDSMGVVRVFNYSNGQEIKCLRLPQSDGKAGSFLDTVQVSKVVHFAKADGQPATRYIVASSQEWLFVFLDGDETNEKLTHRIRCLYGQISSLCRNQRLNSPTVMVGTHEGAVVQYNLFTGAEMAVFSRAGISPSLMTNVLHTVTFLTAVTGVSEPEPETSDSEDSDCDALHDLLGDSDKLDGKKNVEDMAWLIPKGVIASVSGGARIDFWCIKTQHLMYTHKVYLEGMGCFMNIATNKTASMLAVSDDGGVCYVYKTGDIPRFANTVRKKMVADRSVFRIHVGAVLTLTLLSPSGNSDGFVASCGTDLYARLHTFDGKLVGCFGQPAMWSLQNDATWSAMGVVGSLPTKKHCESVKRKKNKTRASRSRGSQSVEVIVSPKKQSVHIRTNAKHEAASPSRCGAKSANVFYPTKSGGYRLAPLPLVNKCLMKKKAAVQVSVTKAAAPEALPNIKNLPSFTVDEESNTALQVSSDTNAALSEQINSLLKEQSTVRTVSEVSRAVQSQREMNPKEWVHRAVSLLPLKGKPGFHKITHPTNTWSSVICQIARRKSKTRQQR